MSAEAAMKVKCTRILNADGCEVESSPWLTLGHIYHVLSMSIDSEGKRSFGITSGYREGEWPHIGSHPQECFEIVSDIQPSNWRATVAEGITEISPAAWQKNGFYEAFSDRDPATYPIFQRERDVILSEDP